LDAGYYSPALRKVLAGARHGRLDRDSHHGSAVDPEAAARHVANLLNMEDHDGQSERWLRGHIDRITAELGP
jgi:hypothetical protein